jgi:hypothetical protein
MAEFNTAHALREADERREQIASGDKLVPVLAAVIAVLAALATLFAHHDSIVALEQKNVAVLYQTKASDQYNYFESKRIKAQIDQALIDSGTVPNGSAGRRKMEARISSETSQANGVLAKAKELEAQADEGNVLSDRLMTSYRNYQIAATLFEVSIVLVSVTALMRTKLLLFVAGGATLVGLGFLGVGFLH